MRWVALVPMCTWRNHLYILGIVCVCVCVCVCAHAHVHAHTFTEQLAHSNPHLDLSLHYLVLPSPFSLESSNVCILHSQQIISGRLASLWGHIQL